MYAAFQSSYFTVFPPSRPVTGWLHFVTGSEKLSKINEMGKNDGEMENDSPHINMSRFCSELVAILHRHSVRKLSDSELKSKHTVRRLPSKFPHWTRASVAPRPAAPGGTEWRGSEEPLTQVVLELLGAAVLSGGDQVPHEAFDFVVSAVVDQAVGQQGSADGLHVPLGQLLLEAAVREDVLPSTPPGKNTHRRQNCLRGERE